MRQRTLDFAGRLSVLGFFPAQLAASLERRALAC
jgi:hypothetical protein